MTTEILAAANAVLNLWDDLYSNMAENDEDGSEREVFETLRQTITATGNKNVKYIARGTLKHTEEDVFSQGCLPETSQTEYIEIEFRADTLDELLSDIFAYSRASSKEDCLFDACGDPGRLDVQVYENDRAERATRKELEDWKQGHVRLWLADYIFQIESVTSELVNLTEACEGKEWFSNDNT